MRHETVGIVRSTGAERLRSDEDIVIGAATQRIRMLGSLRAAKQCLDCHTVQRGELLGALTYELAPIGDYESPGLRGRAAQAHR